MKNFMWTRTIRTAVGFEQAESAGELLESLQKEVYDELGFLSAEDIEFEVTEIVIDKDGIGGITHSPLVKRTTFR